MHLFDKQERQMNEYLKYSSDAQTLILFFLYRNSKFFNRDCLEFGALVNVMQRR